MSIANVQNRILINNLFAHVSTYRPVIDAAIKRVMDRSWFILGPEVSAFEKSFAEYISSSFCYTVGNGTDALELTLRVLDIQPGDKVATVANAGMYTSIALLAVGAKPVYLDVELDTHVVIIDEVERAIQLGVKAIVVTHLYGKAILDIEEIAMRCRQAGVSLIEDCAQAHGARVHGKQVGSFGVAGCFSFYPTKNLGALGDGGAIVTNNGQLAEKIACLRQYGWTSKYQVEYAGGSNSRMDEMQAAILSEFLLYLDNWNARRREIAARYSTRIIRSPSLIVPPVGSEDYVAHLYVIRALNRQALQAHLGNLGIASDIHYPIPDYRQPIFGSTFADSYLPNTERLSKEVLTLPCYPEITNDEVDYIIDAVNSFVSR